MYISKLEVPSDSELIVLIRNDQRDAFEILYRRYFSKMYCVIYKRVKSKEIAEEIVQDLFADLWFKRHRLKIETSFASYIFSCVKYQVFKHYREEHKLGVLVQRQLLENSDTNATEDVIAFNELSVRYNEVLGQLPVKTKKVFTLSRCDYKTNREIASQLGITEKAVEYHITKSLGLLRLNLKEFLTLLISFTYWFMTYH